MANIHLKVCHIGEYEEKNKNNPEINSYFHQKTIERKYNFVPFPISETATEIKRY